MLGFATGSSPLPVYRELVRRHTAAAVVRPRPAFLLDEYVGLPQATRESYRAVIQREFTGRVDLARRACTAPTAARPTSLAACAAYDAAIAAPAASTYSCSASAPTATSASTSRARRSPRGRG